MYIHNTRIIRKYYLSLYKFQVVDKNIRMRHWYKFKFNTVHGER